jgi:rhamnose utilization protein RhaD (predicted bifunctional aldolase and dehydrogenase)
LVTDEEMVDRLINAWALYPDHVVFLGAMPAILPSNFGSIELADIVNKKPAFLFLLGEMVYQRTDVSLAQTIQLRCYFDVARRQTSSAGLKTLTLEQINSLIDWDAEKYRQSLSFLMQKPGANQS